MNNISQQQLELMSVAEDRDTLLPEGSALHKSNSKVLAPILNLMLGELYVGFIIAYISVYPKLQTEMLFGIDPEDPGSDLVYGFLVGIVFLTGAVGAIFSSFLYNKLSRRQCILVFNGIAFVGGALVLADNLLLTFIVGRGLQGFSLGGLSSILPVINKEMSPNSLAGLTGLLNQIFIVVGIILVNIVHSIIDIKDTAYWRLSYGWIYLPLLLQTVFLLGPFRFQTPKYHIARGEEEQARKIIEEFYNDWAVEQVLREKVKDNEAQGGQGDKGQNEESQAMSKGMIKRITVAVSLPLLQQFTGINILVLYINQIFSFNQSLENYIGLIVNCLQLVACFFTAALTTRLGRKQILIGGMLIIVLCNILMGVGFLGAQPTLGGDDPAYTVWLRVLGSLLFFFGFGMSAGPIVWMYIPEIVSGSITGATTLLNWLSSFLIVTFYPKLQKSLGAGAVFLGLAGISALLVLFQIMYMKETKGKSEKEIIDDYES